MKRYEIVASRGLQHDLNELEDYIAIKATAQLKESLKEMNRLNQHRVAHPLRLYRKVWGIALCATALLWTTTPANAKAQASCGLSEVKESATLQYPPIMKAAHVQGPVVLLVKFNLDGSVARINAVSGPGNFRGAYALLRDAAETFVQGWKTNEYSGPRECPVVINFRLTSPADRECNPSEQSTINPSIVTIQDRQHFMVAAENFCLTYQRDPMSRLEHKFLFLHWYSKST